jgi:hypothetical protein
MGAIGSTAAARKNHMANNSDVVFPEAARRAQAERGSARVYARKIATGFPDRVTPELAGFIAALDTAFLATVSADGAPYIQHRGGPKGFIKVIDDRTLGFADFAGNKHSTSPSATWPATTAPICSCSTSPTASASSSGAAPASWRTIRR